MNKLIDRLRDYWGESNTQLRPGVGDAEVAHFERENHVCLTRELRGYFQAVDGMTEDDSDRNLFHFFSLGELGTVAREFRGRELRIAGIPEGSNPPDISNSKRWFIFCDYMIWSHYYAVELGTERVEASPVVVFDGGIEVIATSFSGFLKRYLDDYMSVLPGSNNPH